MNIPCLRRRLLVSLSLRNSGLLIIHEESTPGPYSQLEVDDAVKIQGRWPRWGLTQHHGIALDDAFDD